MILEEIDLYAYFGFPRGGAERGTLTAYRHTQVEEFGVRRLRPAMLVIPGGAYAVLSQKEAEPVALRFFAEGFDCFLLRYDTAPHGYPVQMTQAAMAMLYLRRERERLDLTDKIAAVGFSAGGHLCGCISLLWRDPALKALFGEACEEIRPDAAILSYAVVTSDERYRHTDSFVNFCGDRVGFEAYSLEKHIPSDAPPLFLWATGQDDFVPRENTLMLYSALLRAHLPAEIHIFEEGGHGFSLADFESNGDYAGQRHYLRAAPWVDMALGFLSAHGLTPRTRPIREK